jgi:hypothetical protein
MVFLPWLKTLIMKPLMILFVFLLGAVSVKAQEQKNPVIVQDAPTIFPMSFDPYHSYADQGRAMYINNSQFYNRDNVLTSPVPVSNGQYFTPGNSNPINAEMNTAQPIPSTTIYSGYIPVRQTGDIRPVESDK